MTTATDRKSLPGISPFDRRIIAGVRSRLGAYWALIKSLQTGLLLVTGLAGFSSGACPVTHWTSVLNLAGSLALAISGSTVLNMVYDRDIDARMGRTVRRPLPSGRVSPREGLLLGLGMSAAGVAWAFSLLPVYGLVVFAGLFFDVVVYTIWLKRRTPWSILWGGISGGMPALAGRALAAGEIDAVGLLLALGVVCWIPTHIMTLNMRYHEDYRAARIPTFPLVYGFKVTRWIVTAACLLSAAAFGSAGYLTGLSWGYLSLLSALSVGMFVLALFSLVKPTKQANFGLFKFASVYMLSTMILIFVSGMG